MLRISILILLTVVTIAASTRSDLQRMTLRLHGQPIVVEVASSPTARTKGLMDRKVLKKDHGMLFVQETPQTMCFWMKNTPMALSIAFLEENGEVLAVSEMAPMSLDRHCSPVPVRHALEMPSGWFLQHDAKAGSRLTGAAFVH
jgi:uncharacterized membrane protein (UPF0127 family)